VSAAQLLMRGRQSGRSWSGKGQKERRLVAVLIVRTLGADRGGAVASGITQIPEYVRAWFAEATAPNAGWGPSLN